MSINQQYPILNGVAPSYADIQVKITPSGGDLISMVDIQSINSSWTVEVGEQRGASGGRILRRTTGSLTPEASMTLYRTGYQQMMRVLKDLAPQRGNQRAVSLVHFNVHVIHTPPDESELYEYVIKGCRILGRTLNSTEGTDAEVIEVPLSPIEIVDIIDGVEITAL